jgi:hypothetical protein
MICIKSRCLTNLVTPKSLNSSLIGMFSCDALFASIVKSSFTTHLFGFTLTMNSPALASYPTMYLQIQGSKPQYSQQ